MNRLLSSTFKKYLIRRDLKRLTALIHRSSFLPLYYSFREYLADNFKVTLILSIDRQLQNFTPVTNFYKLR